MTKRARLGGDAAPIAITGSGVVSAAGRGKRTLLASLSDGRRHVERLRRIETSDLPVELGFEMASAGNEMGAAHLRTCASAALRDALVDAERQGRPLDRAKTGLALGTTLGAIDDLVARTGNDPSLDEVRRCLSIDSITTALVRDAELGGPLSVFSLACTSGLCATEQAAADLACGRAEAMLVGGFDTLGRFMQGGFCALRSRAFPSGRQGLFLGEAASFLVLEPVRQARARGHSPGAALLSQRLVSDGVNLAGPDPSGSGMARAVSGCLLDLGLEPSNIGAVLVTAIGSRLHARLLKSALEEALGERAFRVPISTHELAVGHALASTSLLVLAHAASILEEERVYPAFSLSSEELGETAPRVASLTAPFVLALVVGFGGFNGAAVVGSIQELS